MTILLVPGTAKTSVALADLLATHPSHPAYALAVRSKSSSLPKISGTNTLHPTIHLDLANQSTWEPAFSSPTLTSPIKKIYLLQPPSSDFLAVLEAFIRTALNATKSTGGLERIVFLSSSLIFLGGPAHGQVHALLDDLTQRPKDSGLQTYAVLRPSWFTQNFVHPGSQHRGTIKAEGRIYSATGQGRLPFVALKDIAAVGAEALLANDLKKLGGGTGSPGENASWKSIPKGNGTDLLILGPTLHSYDSIASILSNLLQRPITHVDLSQEDLAKKLVEALKTNSEHAAMMASLDGFIAEGAEEKIFVESAGGCVEELLGREAISVEEVLREEIDALRA